MFNELTLPRLFRVQSVVLSQKSEIRAQWFSFIGAWIELSIYVAFFTVYTSGMFLSFSAATGIIWIFKNVADSVSRSAKIKKIDWLINWDIERGSYAFKPLLLSVPNYANIYLCFVQILSQRGYWVYLHSISQKLKRAQDVADEVSIPFVLVSNDLLTKFRNVEVLTIYVADLNGRGNIRNGPGASTKSRPRSPASACSSITSASSQKCLTPDLGTGTGTWWQKYY